MIRAGITKTTLSLAFTSLLTIGIQSAPYEVIDLGSLGGIKNFAFGLNNLNEVVGNSDGELVPEDQVTEDNPASVCAEDGLPVYRTFCNHAYLYSNGVITDLGDYDYDSSFAFALNDNATAVGFAVELIEGNDDDVPDRVRDRAFVSYNGGQVEPLPFPPAADDLPEEILPESRALDVSEDNQVVGYALIEVVSATDDTVSARSYRPFIYDLNSASFQVLPLFNDNHTLGGGARAINAQGQVVGWAGAENEDVSDSVRALLWDPASPEFSKDLGALGGYSSQAWDINDNGYIVGVADTDENYFLNQQLAFVYDTSTETMTQIPEFSAVADFTRSQAYAINNSNQIVGTAQISVTSGNISSAFLFEMGDEALVNLNDMIPCDSGWNLVVAHDINESGHIIGHGTFGGEVKSFLLVPTGETTPTNCTQPSSPGGGDGGSDGDSGSSSFGLFLLPFLALIGLRRQRII